MILVTLGTQKFQMNRLVEAVDNIADSFDEEFFIQTGHSSYTPSHCEFTPFLDKESFEKKISECRILIAHSGVGTIMTGVKHKKPVIVVPRLSKFGEHVDDHQLQIAEAFGQKNIVLACKNIEDLKDCIEEAEKHVFSSYEAPEGIIENIILDFINFNS